MVDERRYVQVVVAWAVGAAVIPAVSTYALSKAADARCDSGMTDCSWGLEALIILPVLVLSLLTMGPLAVYLYLRRKGDPAAGATAGWALVCIPPSVALILFTGGLGVLVFPPLRGPVDRPASTPAEGAGGGGIGAPAPQPIRTGSGFLRTGGPYGECGRR